MKKKLNYIIIVVFLLLIWSKNVFAKEVNYINEEWLKYISLTETEKNKYESIPEKYVDIIDDKQKILKNYKNSFSTVADDSLPSYFNLANYEDQKYINSPKKDQLSLGLCWAFAGIGSAESNILLNGVKGLEEKISLCKDNNSYCSYKEDNEINENYKKGISNINAEFSERAIDYMTTSPTNTTAYNRAGKYDPIIEKYNPFTQNKQFGGGGFFGYVGNLYGYGFAPTRSEKEWQSYNTKLDSKSLYEVFDSVENKYQITDYYNYPNAPASNKEDWINELKRNVMKYGSVYVSTVAPQQSSGRACYYYDTKYNIDGKKQYISLINYNGNCGSGSLGWHAMQIIGWDDLYKFGYCKVGNNADDNYTKKTCTEAGYTWTEGTGAWILKNSWGYTRTYPYLSYISTGSSISGVREVRVKDYDNAYNKIMGLNSQTSKYITINGRSSASTIYEFKKPLDTEYLSHININFSSAKSPYMIYFSNDGENYEFITDGTTDYSGLRTFDFGNKKLDKDVFYLKIVGNVNSVNVFTKNECTINSNCTSDENISTVMNKTMYEEGSTVFKVLNKTQNIPSGSKIQYKILDSNNSDITNSFNIPNTYVINNMDTVKITSKNKLSPGQYKLVSTYNETSNEYIFYILGEKIVLNLEAPNEIFLSNKTLKVNAKVNTPAGINKYNWSVSNDDIASIDNDGLLTLKKSGKLSVILTLDTIYGEVQDSIDIIVYKEISSTDDFFNIFKENTGAYYLMNDLDFKDIDYGSKIENKYFKGIFNGNYNVLKNIKYSADISGIFPYLLDANVMNIKILTSDFFGNMFAGSISGYAENSIISNIYNESNVESNKIAGGIIGYGTHSTIYETFNGGQISININNSSAFAGGLLGKSDECDIKNSYNTGAIKENLETFNATENIEIYLSGINGYSNNTIIDKVYNTGVLDNISHEKISMYRSGITNNYDNVTNSYYLNDDTYNIIEDSSKKTLAELKAIHTFKDWDFNNIWQIVDSKYTPIFKKFPVETTNINFNLFSNILNTNSNYTFDYELIPIESTEDVVIESTDTSLFTIENNTIQTKNKIGTAYIKFKIKEKEYTFPISVIDLIDIEYDKNLTGKYVDININYNYYLSSIENKYIKFEYKIDNIYEYHNFEKNVINDKYTFRIYNNGIVNIKLSICDDNKCDSLYEDNLTINNIDKTNPIIDYYTDNIKKELKINIYDDNGLSVDNDYIYGLSSSNKIMPNFKKFTLNKIFKDISLSNENYYLWVKRVYDKSGNGLCDTPYCIYKLELVDNFYKIFYYDEDQKTLLKTERLLENSKLIPSFSPKKESNINFDYEFIGWTGYTKDMKLKENLNLIAKYRGIFRGLSSKNYIIENGIISGIKLDNINSVYETSKFMSNINYIEEYNFYEGNIIHPEYIKTGLLFKSNYRQFKIALAGDVTGDGKVKMNDVMKIANQIVNGNVLKDEYLVAGDVTGDGKIKMNDVMKIASGLVNGGNL